jgi:hypothetical protein
MNNGKYAVMTSSQHFAGRTEKDHETSSTSIVSHWPESILEPDTPKYEAGVLDG